MGEKPPGEGEDKRETDRERDRYATFPSLIFNITVDRQTEPMETSPCAVHIK